MKHVGEGHDAFLAKQALTENDLLTLIEGGRLKIISTQAEERLKIPFLAEAAERSPSAIIGRRTSVCHHVLGLDLCMQMANTTATFILSAMKVKTGARYQISRCGRHYKCRAIIGPRHSHVSARRYASKVVIG